LKRANEPAMTRMHFHITLLALAISFPLAAQERGSARGTVVDRESGKPVLRMGVSLGDEYHTRGDTLGRFAFDSVPTGRYRLRVYCASPTSIEPEHLLWEGNLRVVAEGNRPRNLRVDAGACDQRPFIDFAGEFRGFFEGAFESSRFVPCPGPRGGIPPSRSALRDTGTYIWANFAPGSVAEPWPDGEESQGITRWYIRWRGTIRGPDRYGHLGSSPYEARIDKVFVLRRPAAGDCKVESPDSTGAVKGFKAKGSGRHRSRRQRDLGSAAQVRGAAGATLSVRDVS
jgi:hypothetical protein